MDGRADWQAAVLTLFSFFPAARRVQHEGSVARSVGSDARFE